jgi:hypothetical protein
MNTPPESAADAALVARARELLAASADGLDGRTRSRLTQARHAALAAAAGPPGLLARLLGGLGRPRWMPAGVAVASLLVVALVVTRMPGVPGSPVHSVGNGGEDIELLADADELALAQESESDYDFYAWAVAAADADAPATAVTGA